MDIRLSDTHVVCDMIVLMIQSLKVDQDTFIVVSNKQGIVSAYVDRIFKFLFHDILRSLSIELVY